MMYKWNVGLNKNTHAIDVYNMFEIIWYTYISIIIIIYIYITTIPLSIFVKRPWPRFLVISALICRKNVVLLPVGLQHSFALTILSGKQTVPTKAERCVFFPSWPENCGCVGFPGMCMYNYYIYILHFFGIYCYYHIIYYHKIYYHILYI